MECHKPTLITYTTVEQADILEQRNVQSRRAVKLLGICTCLLATAGITLIMGSVRTQGLRSDSVASEFSVDDRLKLYAKHEEFEKLWAKGVGSTTKATKNIDAGVGGLKKSAAQAKQQIDDWAVKEMSASTGKIAVHIHKLSVAVVNLVNIETDFKQWCATQQRLFALISMKVKSKLDDAVDLEQVDLAIEATLLERSLHMGQEDMVKMQKKVSESQIQFTDLVASTKSLQQDIKKAQKAAKNAAVDAAFAAPMFGSAFKSVASWAAPQWTKFYNSFDDQLETVGDMNGKLNQLGKKAQEDYKTMGEVRGKMSEVETFAIDDPLTFKEVTIPALDELVQLLTKIAKRPLGFDKIFK